MIPGNVQVVSDIMKEIINFQIVEKETLYDKLMVPIFGESPDQDEEHDTEEDESGDEEDEEDED